MTSADDRERLIAKNAASWEAKRDPRARRPQLLTGDARDELTKITQAGRERAAQLRDERDARKLAVTEAQQAAVKPQHGPTHKPVIAPTTPTVRLHL